MDLFHHVSDTFFWHHTLLLIREQLLAHVGNCLWLTSQKYIRLGYLRRLESNFSLMPFLRVNLLAGNVLRWKSFYFRLIATYEANLRLKSMSSLLGQPTIACPAYFPLICSNRLGGPRFRDDWVPGPYAFLWTHRRFDTIRWGGLDLLMGSSSPRFVRHLERYGLE